MTSAALSTPPPIFTSNGRVPIESVPAPDVIGDMAFSDALVAASAQLESVAQVLVRTSSDQPAGAAAMQAFAEEGAGIPAARSGAGFLPSPLQGNENVQGEGSHAWQSPSEPEWVKTLELMVEQAGVNLSAQWLPAANALRTLDLGGGRSLPGEALGSEVLAASVTDGVNAGESMLPSAREDSLGDVPDGYVGALTTTSASKPVETDAGRPVPQMQTRMAAQGVLPAGEAIAVSLSAGRAAADPGGVTAQGPSRSSLLPTKEENALPNPRMDGGKLFLELKVPAEITDTAINSGLPRQRLAPDASADLSLKKGLESRHRSGEWVLQQVAGAGTFDDVESGESTVQLLASPKGRSDLLPYPAASVANSEPPPHTGLAVRLRPGEPPAQSGDPVFLKLDTTYEGFQASTNVSPKDDPGMLSSSSAHMDVLLESLSRSAPAAGQKSVVDPTPSAGRNDHAELSQRMADALGARLSAQIARGVWTMQLQLQPAQLGSIDIRLVMDQGRLRAQLKTGETLTRDLILEGLPRLRESLEQAGLNVSDVHVDLEYEDDRGKNTAEHGLREPGNKAAPGSVESDIVTVDRKSPDDLSMLDLFI